MAQLSHLNVVRVHDAGTYPGGFFIAMELVEGTTLRKWLGRARPWREVVAVFVAAGRGLAAAHAIGLVHRDFKPDNVLVEERDDRPATRGGEEQRPDARCCRIPSTNECVGHGVIRLRAAERASGRGADAARAGQ